MKVKQAITSKANKASDKALLRDVASKLSNEVLFRDKVAKAKLYLKQATFSSQKKAVK